MTKPIRKLDKNNSINYKALKGDSADNIRFGIKFGHTILAQDNWTEIDKEIFDCVNDVCMKHFMERIIEISESLNLKVPMTFPFIEDEEILGNTLSDIINGYSMAREGAPADCDLFTRKL